MALLKYATKTEIPEDLRDAAVENKDGEGFVITVAPKAKLDTFRENNQTLSGENDRLKAQNATFAKIIGEDPDAFAEEITNLRGTAQQVADGKLKKSEDIEAELTRRTEAMKASHENKIREVQAENSTLKQTVSDQGGKLTGNKIDQYLRDQASSDKLGINMAAMSYILKDGREEFEVDDDERIVRKVNGEVQLGEDGFSPQTGAEWLESRREATPFFFVQSNGGGAGGGDGGSSGYTKKQIAGMSAAEKLAIANKNSQKEGKW